MLRRIADETGGRYHRAGRDLAGLAPAAADDELLGVGAEMKPQPAPAAFDFLVQDGHRVLGGIAREIAVPVDRLLDDPETVLDGAVVQVNIVAVDGEGLLDREPEVLVGRDGLGAQACRGPSRLEDLLKDVGRRRGQDARADGAVPEEITPAQVFSFHMT